MFSQLLYSHRRRRAMSQEDLAKRAGLTARSIRNLEGGSVRTPRPGTVRRLADGLALDGADRERFESAAVETYLGERGVERVDAARPRFVVTEGVVTTPGGGLTVRWTQEAPVALPDTEFRVTITGFTAPHTARRPADLLRAVLDALGAHAQEIPGGRETSPEPGEGEAPDVRGERGAPAVPDTRGVAGGPGVREIPGARENLAPRGAQAASGAGRSPAPRGASAVPGMRQWPAEAGRGISASPGTRGTPAASGTRGVPAVPGTRGTPAVPGTRGTPAVPAARGVPAVASGREAGAVPGRRNVPAGPVVREVPAGPDVRPFRPTVMARPYPRSSP